MILINWLAYKLKRYFYKNYYKHWIFVKLDPYFRRHYYLKWVKFHTCVLCEVIERPRLPRDLVYKVNLIIGADKLLTEKYGKFPPVEEVSEFTGYPVNLVRRILLVNRESRSESVKQ